MEVILALEETKQEQFHFLQNFGTIFEALPREGSPENHFYSDKYKYNFCLPTKTSSFNWQKAIFSVYRFKGAKNLDEIDKNYIYHQPQMPKFRGELQEFVRGRNGLKGYFTMMTVRNAVQQ